MAGSLLCWTHPLVAMTDSYCPPDWTGQQHLSGLTLVRPMSNSSGTNNSALPALSRSGIQEHLAWRPSKPYIVGQVWQQQQMPDSTTRMNIGPMSGAIADSDAVVFPECGGGASSCISVDELAAQLQRKADIRSSSSSYDCLLSIGDSALDCDRSASCQRLLTPVTVEEADGINVWLSQQVGSQDQVPASPKDGFATAACRDQEFSSPEALDSSILTEDELSDLEAWLVHQDSIEDCAPSRHLWLGNLSPRLSRQVLHGLLQQYGAVEDVITFPGRMYAFANFQATADAAAAASALQGKSVPSLTAKRKLIVKFRPSRCAMSRISSFQLLDAEQIDTSLIGFVEDHCGVVGVPPLAKENKSWGTSSVRNDLSPTAAHRNLPADATRHLWFGNIPLKPNRAAMEHCFSVFGRVESLRVFPGKTYAFVNFESVDSAVLAKICLDGVHIPSVSGTRPMIIRFQAESSAATAAAKQDGKSGGSRTTGGLHDLAHLRLSNKLNPNNIYFDPVLAERYKRMTKAEKDTMWVQDSQSRTSAGLGTSNAEMLQRMQIGYYQGNRVNNQGNHGVLSPLRCSMDSSWSPTPDLYFSDVPMSTSGASDPGCVRAESVCAGLWGSIHGASALAGLQSQSKLPYAWGYNRLPVSCPDDASVAMNGGLGHQSNLPVPSRAHSCDGAVQTLGELPHHAAVSANFLAHDTHGGTLPMASTQPCVSCPLSPASGSLLQASSNEQSAPCDDTYAALLTSDTLLRSLAMYMSSAQN